MFPETEKLVGIVGRTMKYDMCTSEELDNENWVRAGLTFFSAIVRLEETV
jgi:hypothetical protein